MKKLAALFFGIGASLSAWSQDMHFAQSAQTPIFINPAAAGVFDGWERVTINHRNQWLGATTQFMTTAISADANLGKSVLNDRAHMGVAVQFYNDVGGDSRFGNTTGTLSLSGILPMGGSGHILSIGLQGGLGSRRADLSNVTFMSQWDASTTTFNPLVSSGEQYSSTFNYLDASAGLYYIYDGSRNSFARNNDVKFRIGFSAFHVNKPKLRYRSGQIDRLHRKYVAHLGFSTDFVGRPLALEVDAVQFIQGGHYETLFGFLLKYRFENATKITGNNQDAFVGFGANMRWKDAIIPTVAIDWKGLHFGISYDVTISALRKAYGGGSLEFSLGYTNFDTALFKTRKRRF